MINRRSKNPFLQKVRLTISEYSMIPAGTGVVAAVSGGPDSVAMLYALVDLSKDQHFRIVVAHFDHALRPESSQEALFVSKLADKWGLECLSERGDVREYSRIQKISIEEAGRLLRYDFLERTRKEAGVPVIAVGHHIDDELETFFLRLCRGASLDGLCGIPPVRGNIIRPLIRVDRRQVVTFLQEHNISYAIDSSNLEDTTERNFIRNIVFPVIKRRFEGFQGSLCRTIRVLNSENKVLENTAYELYRKAVAVGEDELHLDRLELLDSPTAVWRRVVMRALYSLSGPRSRFVQSHLNLVSHLLVADKPSGYVQLPRGILVQRIYDTIRISKVSPSLDWQDFGLNINGPGIIDIPHSEMRLRFETFFVQDRIIDYGSCLAAYFDADLLPFPLLVRPPSPGDRLRPWGLQGSRKLKKIFIDAKVPLYLRRGFPLVVKDGEIVWIPGLRRGWQAPVRSETERVLEVRLLGETPLALSGLTDLTNSFR